MTRTLPIEGDARNFFLWYCDRGPQSHLKLLIYLNDADEQGGSTQHLSLRDTDAIAAELARSAAARTGLGYDSE